MVRSAIAVSLLVGSACPAFAAQSSEELNRLEVRAIIDGRIRYENVNQGDLAADALTIRVRAGAEGKIGAFSLLAEGEGTAAPLDNYNAFPFPLANSDQRRPEYATIADPANLELNRIQLRYETKGGSLTLGRQRINLDDQRWVGSVGWRQNEQTFDAIRGEAFLGSVKAELGYAISQRTVFGEHAGPRQAYGGDFVLVGLSSLLGPVEGKLFTYGLNYKDTYLAPNSSQTYGAVLSSSIPIGIASKLNLRGSFARQSDIGSRQWKHSADYWHLQGATMLGGVALSAGWELLGSHAGKAVQTPLATLHKFNGWADMFLTTPPGGLADSYISISRTFGGVKAFSDLTASLTFHKFDSAVGNQAYGTEWDASLGFKLGRIGILAKLADYDANTFGTNTRKMWLQADWVF